MCKGQDAFSIAMPTSALRPCLGGCGALGRFPRGRCSRCAGRAEGERRAARGGFDYSAKWWRRWREQFIGGLVSLGIAPVCGATMPDGPAATISACRAQGLETAASSDGSGLHLHHEPPLTEAEVAAIRAGNRALACDETRIVLACRSCHSTETMTGRTRSAA